MTAVCGLLQGASETQVFCDYQDARLVRVLVRSNARLLAADEVTLKTDTLPMRCIVLELLFSS